MFDSAVHGTARQDYSQLQLDTWAPRDFDIDAWTARLIGISPFVALLDAAIAGYADLQRSGCIDHFYVACAAGGRGVGRRLMLRLFAQAQEWGLAELTSDVSLTAQPFFAHFGFEVVEHRVLDLRGVEMHNALMRRRLP